jgi:hypothetical protein
MKYKFTEYLLQEMLCEMPQLNNISTSDNREFFELLADNKIAYKEPKKIVELPNMVLVTYSKGKDIEFVGYRSKHYQNSNAIVFVGVTTQNKYDFPLVCYSETLASEKRQGLMSTVYDYIIQNYGGLISDDSISQDIKPLYVKLIPKYNSYIINHDYNIKKKIEAADGGTFKTHKEMIMMTKEPLDIKEWNSI